MPMIDRQGLMLVLSSPSGAGKTAIALAISDLEAMPLSVSATTESESWARPRKRRSSSAIDGGRINTRTTFSGIAVARSLAPCQSTSNNTSVPCSSASTTGARGVP